LLNPDKVSSLVYDGERIDPPDKLIPVVKLPEPVNRVSVQKYSGEGQSWSDIRFRLHEPAKAATFCFLLEPSGEFVDGPDPEVGLILNGEPVGKKQESQEGRWTWYMRDVPLGSHLIRVQISPPEGHKSWSGTASAWLVLEIEPDAKDVSIELKQELPRLRPVPPKAFRPGQFRQTIKLGSFDVSTK
jgi:hypothetical protein